MHARKASGVHPGFMAMMNFYVCKCQNGKNKQNFGDLSIFFKLLLLLFFFFEQEGNKTQGLINGLTWQFFAFVVTYSFFSQSFW